MEEDPSETGSVSEAWPNHNLDQSWGTWLDHNGPIGHISLLDALFVFYHIFFSECFWVDHFEPF